MSRPTWFQAIQLIRQEFSDANQIEATVRRVFLPCHGFSLAGSRATKAEMQQAEVFMESEDLPNLSEQQWMESLEQYLVDSSLTNSPRRSSRCYGKKFIAHLKNQGWLISTEQPKRRSVKDLYLKRRHPDAVVDKSYISKSKVYKQPRISLSFQADDYLEVYQGRFPNLKDTELLKIIQKELERIKKEQQDCLNFLIYRDKDPLSKGSQRNWLAQIDRLLGWRFHRCQDLAEVGLEKIIPVVNLKVSLEDFEDNLNDYYIAKGKAEQKAKKAANHTIDFLKDFFRYYGNRYKTSSKIFYIEALTSTAKFLYDSITDNTDFSNYKDIPVICKLGILRQNLPKAPPEIQNLPLTWNESVLILKELKKRFDDHFYYVQKGNGEVDRYKREIAQMAKDLERFLALSLLVIIPPLRCRTLAELELGRTIRCGLLNDSGSFIPRENLTESSLAKYYYHMMPNDYKTGKIYGEIFVQLPNCNFDDKTCFYDYLNQWFFEGYRDSLLVHQQNHQCMFVKLNKSHKSLPGDPMKPNNFADLIYIITKQFTGIRVGPHTFRKIYRTHLINSNATSQELASAAFFMQHTEEMAAKSYTIQTLNEKTSPILNFISRVGVMN